MRMDIERIFLRIEARRARDTARTQGARCPAGCAEILANDTPVLAAWDAHLYEQWRARYGLSEAVAAGSDTALYGVGG